MKPQRHLNGSSEHPNGTRMEFLVQDQIGVKAHDESMEWDQNNENDYKGNTHFG